MACRNEILIVPIESSRGTPTTLTVLLQLKATKQYKRSVRYNLENSTVNGIKMSSVIIVKEAVTVFKTRAPPQCRPLRSNSRLMTLRRPMTKLTVIALCSMHSSYLKVLMPSYQ